MSDLFFSDAPQETILGEETVVSDVQRALVPTTSLDVFEATAAKVFSEGPVSNIIASAEYAYDKAFNPDALEILKEVRQGNREAIDDILSRAPSGALSGLNKLSGATIGFLADPANLAASLFAPELIGTKSAQLFSALADRAFSKEASATVGEVVSHFLEGSAVMTPGELTQLGTAHLYDEDYDALDATAGIMIGGGIGVGAGLLFKGLSKAIGVGEKSYRSITTESTLGATEDAVGQMASGNRVDVSMRIKKGFQDAREQTDVSMGDVEVQRQKLTNELDAVRSDKGTLVGDVEEAFTQGKRVEPLSLEELHNRIKRISNKDPELLHSLEKSIIEKVVPHKELNTVTDLVNKDAEFLLEDDLSTLTNHFDKESDIIADRIELEKEQINEIDSTLSKDVVPEERNRLEKQKDELQDSLELADQRIDEIESISDERPVEDTLKQLDDLEDKEGQINNDLDDLSLIQDALNKQDVDITGAEANKISRGNINGDNESAFDLSDNTIREEANEVEGFGEELTEDKEALVDQLVKDKELPQDTIDTIETVNKEVELQPKYVELIDSISECILKNLK